ncbi:DUF2777 family protein [Schinkia azotoformans]|uniref:DUF2777 family protein n=1 Tax=Schinkia azotoformans TaxID=1454 RepID=UPI002DBD748B|nr:DUF2777 family protein [Schinkia azotoformans]MEC1715723.1 DUF2777 family protein [Schinkia azotoformans]MEC1741362.1 DUF2777 family protein [Schinkia azotoformans]MEC1744356.1 DUF2777 family protein [Schinkia azotoformans]MEC1758653.1 DUF2777 family protein [Schinkia azotoformans]MEC1765455.1 DUF2777 family protein [Schinkia azotoformans]
MNLHRKLAVIPFQERAFVEGTLEQIGDEWIFFDEINEEAFDLGELSVELEVFLKGMWMKGIIIDNSLLYIENDFHYFKDGDRIRYKKNLTHSFEKLIEELSEESYMSFVETLNSLSYSLYDCVFCNNFLDLLQMRQAKEGMNVIIFDNEEQICVVQHYFSRHSDNKIEDRFEFALSDGKRIIGSFIL